MVEHRRADALREIREHAFLGFGDRDEMLLEPFAAAGLLDGLRRGQRLEQGFRRATGFRDHDEARGLEVDRGQRVLPAPGIGIVVEGDARRRAGFRDGLQRLAAQAGAADAEHGDVGGILGPRVRDGLGGGDVVGAFDDVEKLDSLVLLLCAQPGERRGAVLQRGIEGGAGDRAGARQGEVEGNGERQRCHGYAILLGWRTLQQLTRARRVSFPACGWWTRPRWCRRQPPSSGADRTGAPQRASRRRGSAPGSARCAARRIRGPSPSAGRN